MDGGGQPPSRRVIVAGAVGNVLEWFDFTVYVYFASTISTRFFPRDNSVDGLIATFGIFAAGYLMRPLGGLIFGHIGDRHGRKPALVIAMIAMALPTFAIGLLPTAAEIGSAAALLLVTLRMLQGISMGGEYTGSVAFFAERAPQRWRGLYAIAPLTAAGFGALLGSGSADLMSALLSDSQFERWGWRLPFLAGGILGVVGIYLRFSLPADQMPMVARTPPIVDTLRCEWRPVLRIVGLNLMHAVSVFMIVVFMKTYLQQDVGMTRTQALTIALITTIAMMAATASGAVLSDRIGRKPVLIGSAVALILAASPLLALVHRGEFWIVVASLIALCVIVGPYAGTAPVAMAETVPTRVRVTGSSLGYNVCIALFGGTTPVVAVSLIGLLHTDLAPAYYMMVAAAVSLPVVILGLRETANRPLE